MLFVANLLALFFGNEEETRLLRDEVRGSDTYGGRLVPMLNLLYRGGANQLVLERRPNPDLIDYFRGELGLGVPEIQVVGRHLYEDLGDQLIRPAAAGTIDGYVTDEALTALARQLDLPTVSAPAGTYYQICEHYIRGRGRVIRRPGPAAL